MSRKSSKVSEPKALYAKKPAKKAAAPKTEAGGVRRMSVDSFQKSSAEVFKVHHELFRKLAQ